MHQLNRVRAVTAVHITFATTGNSFSVLRVIDPIPTSSLIFLLPVTWIGDCHNNSPFFSFGLPVNFDGHDPVFYAVISHGLRHKINNPTTHLVSKTACVLSHAGSNQVADSCTGNQNWQFFAVA